MGLWLVFTNPPYQSNDEDRHFLHAYNLSEGRLFYRVSPDSTQIGEMFPERLLNTIGSFQGIHFQEGDKLEKEVVDSIANIPLIAAKQVFYHHVGDSSQKLGYIPAAVGIALGKHINNNAIWLGYWGRIGSLLAYLLIVFIAIKTAPILKNSMMVFALSPMVMYQATSVTYDTLLFGISFMILGYSLKLWTADHQIGITKLIILTGIFSSGMALIKPGYFFIPLLLLMGLSQIEKLISRWTYYLVLAIVSAVAYWLSVELWQLINPDLSISDPIVFQKDFLFDSQMNLKWAMAKPLDTARNLILNLGFFRQEWWAGVFGKFGYAYAEMPGWIYLIQGIMFMIIPFLDNINITLNNPSDKEISRMKWISASVFLLVSGVAITGFYIISPVGAEKIFGFQGRYLVPAFIALIPFFYQSKYRLSLDNKLFSLLASIYALAVLIYTIVFVDGYYYHN